MNETRESKDTTYWHERPKEHTEEKPDMTLPPHPKAPYIFGPLNSPPSAPPIKREHVFITNPSPGPDVAVQKIHDPDCEVTRKGSTICTCPLPGGI